MTVATLSILALDIFAVVPYIILASLVVTVLQLLTQLQKTLKCPLILLSEATKMCPIPLSWKQPRCSHCQHQRGISTQLLIKEHHSENISLCAVLKCHCIPQNVAELSV